MKYTLENGKTVNIPDKEINNYMQSLELSKEDAIALWLDDNDYTENEEQNILDEKAKKIKISRGASSDIAEKKEKKPRTTIVSDEKVQLFNDIVDNLSEIYGSDLQIVTQNKLITIKIGAKTFKIDLIEQRQPKKK